MKDKRTEGKHGATVSATLGCLFSSSKKGDNSGLPGLASPSNPNRRSWLWLAGPLLRGTHRPRAARPSPIRHLQVIPICCRSLWRRSSLAKKQLNRLPGPVGSMWPIRLEGYKLLPRLPALQASMRLQEGRSRGPGPLIHNLQSHFASHTVLGPGVPGSQGLCS